jgi:hypothetical protein
VKKIVLLFFVTPILFSCNQVELEKLRKENEELKAKIVLLEKRIDEIENGPERLLVQVKNAMNKKEYRTAINIARNLILSHPGLDEAVEAEKISDEAKKQIAVIEAEEAKKKQEEEKRVLSSITTNRDDVEGIAWYYDKKMREKTLDSRMYLYFGKYDKGTLTNLRIVIDHTYSSSMSWLFIEEYIFNVDGKRYSFKPAYSDIKRDNTADTMWEIIGASLTNNQELQGIVNAIINSTKATLRVSGKKYYSDRDITSVEKQGMKNILAAYDFVKTGKIN